MHNVTFNPLFENFKISWPTNTELNNPNLRNHLDFYIPPARTSTAKRLPLHTFPSSWNRLDNPIAKSIWKISLFNNIISTTMLNNLPESVICSRLGCPHCHLRPLNFNHFPRPPSCSPMPQVPSCSHKNEKYRLQLLMYLLRNLI